MNDNGGKGTSCLAITEKKNQQRPGGCIGIFFQLFDWNRRLTKKRLFSEKLLPPARANQSSSKKFKADEKMPNSKLHLIANENNGGFPSAKKGGNLVIEAGQKHDMRAPGLVARLMGLESVPASKPDESKKSSFSDTCVDGDDEKESLGNHASEAEKHVVDLEMGVAKHESRPQKLRRTGTCDRRAVTRFGAEALQMKCVLSRARKYNNNHHHHHHLHPKLPSPLNSPKITSGKSATRSSRLIGAATKILEPGLQARSRARCALASSAASIYPPKDGAVTKKFQSCYEASTANSLTGHTSCQNCGNLLDVFDCRPQVLEHPAVPPPPPIVSDVLDVSTLVSAQKRRSFVPCHEQDVVLLRSQEKIISTCNEEQGKSNAYSCNESTTRRMPLLGKSPTKWSSLRQRSRVLQDDASSFAFRHKTKTQEHVFRGERTFSASRMSNMQVKRVSSVANTENRTKDFVALNRSLSSRTRMRSPTKVDSSKFDLERKPSNRQEDDSMSRVRTLERKRRTPNVSQFEGMVSVNPVTVKQRSISYDVQRERRRDFNTSSPNNSYNVKIRRGGLQRTDKVNDNKVDEVISFTFNSPCKQKITPEGKEETGTDSKIKAFFLRPPPLRADAVGAFLEKKFKELSSQEGEELSTGGHSKRSTAMILQELISALSTEHLTCTDDLVFEDKHEANQERLSGIPCNGSHLSPGSVLQASFSSSSLDESSGHGFHLDSTNCLYNQLERYEHDAELLDSATSFNEGKTGSEILIELVNQIPRIIQSLNSFGTRLTESELSHMKDVILNAELVLGNGSEHGKDGVPQLLFPHLLPDQLVTATGDAMWTDFPGFMSCENSEEEGILKGFFFDCVIEYLESNCCQHNYKSVFKAWTKLPLCMKAEMLVQEVKKEIMKWTCLAGKLPDEIIEWEMSHSLGKWTDFNIEAFEAGVDIDEEVLQVLVDEIVEDFVDSRSCY